MNNSDQAFADLPDHFLVAINRNQGTLRQSRCLCISSSTFEWLGGVSDGYALVDAPGGGMVTWYLCRHQGNLYFVFQTYTSNPSNPYSYSGRETSRFEVEELLYSYGGGVVGIDGILHPYEDIVGPRAPRAGLDNLFDELANPNHLTQR